MQQNTKPAESTDALAEGVRAAFTELATMLDRVHCTGEPTLAVAYFHLNSIDPFVFLDSARMPSVVWSNSRDGSCIVDLGAQ